MRSAWCATLVVFFLPWSGLAEENVRLDAALGANFTAGPGVELYVEATLSQGIWSFFAHAGYQENRLRWSISKTLNFGEDRVGLGLNFQEELVLQLQASRQQPDFQLDLQGSFSAQKGWSWTLKSLWKPSGLGLSLEGQAQVLEGKPDTWSQKFHWEDEGLSLDEQVDSAGWKPLQFSAQHSFHEMTFDLSGQLDLLDSKLLDAVLSLSLPLGEFDADASLQFTPSGWQELRVGGTRKFGIGANHLGGSLSFGPEGWQDLSVDGLWMLTGTGDLWQGRLAVGPEGFSDLLLTGNVNRSALKLAGTVTGSPALWLLDLSGSAQWALFQLAGKLSWMSLSGLRQGGLRAGRSFEL